MFLESEQRGLPAFQVVAFRALALFRAGFELALVGIRLMAIIAVCEWDLFVEVAVDVARHTRNLGVLANQGIFCFGVIEIKSCEHRLPTTCGVAGFARFLELPFVRIHVAG